MLVIACRHPKTSNVQCEHTTSSCFSTVKAPNLQGRQSNSCLNVLNMLQQQCDSYNRQIKWSKSPARQDKNQIHASEHQLSRNSAQFSCQRTLILCLPTSKTTNLTWQKLSSPNSQTRGVYAQHAIPKKHSSMWAQTPGAHTSYYTNGK